MVFSIDCLLDVIEDVDDEEQMRALCKYEQLLEMKTVMIGTKNLINTLYENGFYVSRVDGDKYCLSDAGGSLGVVDTLRQLEILFLSQVRINKNTINRIIRETQLDVRRLPFDFYTGRRHQNVPGVGMDIYADCLRVRDIPGDMYEMVEVLDGVKIPPSVDTLGKEVEDILEASRAFRKRQPDRGSHSKKVVSLGTELNSTYAKFRNDFVGRVLHPGSGPPGCLSQEAFPSATAVICVDPVYNGLYFDNCGHEPVHDYDAVVSDACVYTANYGLSIQTNNINIEIIEKIPSDMPLIAKFYACEQSKIPAVFKEFRWRVLHHGRMHNLEVILRRDCKGDIIDDIFRRVRYVSVRSNFLRNVVDFYHYNCRSISRSSVYDTMVVWTIKNMLRCKTRIEGTLVRFEKTDDFLNRTLDCPNSDVNINLLVFQGLSITSAVTELIKSYTKDRVLSMLTNYALMTGQMEEGDRDFRVCDLVI